MTLTAQPVLARNELPDLGDPTLSSFSSKEEHELGQAFYHALRANLEFVDDLQLQHYLTSLGQRLVSHSDAAGSSFRFFIIESPVINAFAGPDGHIGIHSGLIKQANNESQLAGVMAHEIAHVSQRHIARAISGSGGMAAASFATILAAILIGSRDPEAAQAVLMTGIAGTQQASLNFTRQNEYEADRIGIGVLSQSGINPSGMVEFFEILLSRSRAESLEYLRTHPLSSNRVSEARGRISDKHSDLPKNSDDFRYARARLEVLTGKQLESFANQPLKDNENNFEAYKKATALITIHKAEQAIPILKNLAEKDNHPWVSLALAEAYDSSGKDKQALQVLEKLSGLYPDYLPVTLAYASALIDNQQIQKSITLLQHQLQSEDSAHIYKTLARAYFKNGQTGAALESTGDQYAREGYFELALQQYENALQQSGISQSTRQRLIAKKESMESKGKSVK